MSSPIRCLGALVLLSVIVLMSACTVPPRPVYRAEVQGEPAFWQQGQRLVTRDAAGLEITAGFDKHANRRLVFDVALFNASPDTLEILPAQFTLQDSALAWGWAANDPEERLLAADKSASRARARKESQEQTDLLLGTLNLAAELAEPPDTDEEAQAREEARQTEALERAERDRRYDQSRRSLAGLREEWSRSALRRSTLEPGMTIVGKLYFTEPATGGAAMLVLDTGLRRLALPVTIDRYEVSAYPGRQKKAADRKPANKAPGSI